MKIFAAALAALLRAAGPVRAGASDELSLRRLGDRLRSLTDQDYRDMAARPEAARRLKVRPRKAARSSFAHGWLAASGRAAMSR